MARTNGRGRGRRRKPPFPEPQEILKALAHPTRRAILARLEATEEARSPSQLTAELEDAPGLANVAYHVRQMAAANILTEVRTEPRRGAIEHFYAYASPTVQSTVVAVRAAAEAMTDEPTGVQS